MKATEEELSPDELREALVAIGEERYHHKHPFHLLMHEGKLSKGQLQAWALNRYYYQSRIPVKDAIILSRSNDPTFRRLWRKRIVDHDGDDSRAGGIERWVRLAESTGLSREQVVAEEGILPAVRFSVDAYLRLVSEHTFLIAVASSLTEMFSGKLIALRIDRMKEHYPWMVDGLEYFQHRLKEGPEDAEFALDWVTKNARTRQDQEDAMFALRSKCDILWAQLDAIHHAYVAPGTPPPGAFKV